MTRQQEYYRKNREKKIQYQLQRYYLKRDEILQQSKINRQKEETKQRLKEYDKKYRQKNSERSKQYYLKHREKQLNKYQGNKELRQKQALEYYYNNKDKVRARNKRRLKEDPVYKIECTLRWSFNRALKSRDIYKTNTFKKLVGCTLLEFKDYIEQQWQPGMSWENHSFKGWHLDHIKPINTFDLKDIEEQKKCFHYTNFRPLWYKDNLCRPKDGRDIF